MKRPLIAITPDYDEQTGYYKINARYMEAVCASGGTGVLLGMDMAEADVELLAERFDGFLFSGGGDIAPSYFREAPHPCCGKVSPRRDAFELPLLRAAVRRGRPVLAVCRGVQVLNVALGGTIYQDIPSQLGIEEGRHRQQEPYDRTHHEVELTPGGLLARVTGKARLSVNSVHHQAVRDVAPGMVVEARSGDGVIEALSLAGREDVLGVQWHPEQLFAQDAAQRALFAHLIARAGERG